jgi:glycosyltransferase involved in cell wall biosynthesis
MQNKKVSVIIPSYNRFKYLLDAIASVEKQTYKDFEIIVVNDGSTQQQYYDFNFPDYVKILHIDRKDTPDWGGSRPAVRNYGIDTAQGEYIAFLDDDDIWFPEKLEFQIDAMEKHDVGFSATEGFFGSGRYDEKSSYPLYNTEHHFKKIKQKYKKTKYLKKGSFDTIWTYDFLKIHNCVVLSSVLVNSNYLKQLGGFRGLYRSNLFVHTADHDCWLGLLQLTNLVYINTPLFFYDASHGDGKNYIN